VLLVQKLLLLTDLINLLLLGVVDLLLANLFAFQTFLKQVLINIDIATHSLHVFQHLTLLHTHHKIGLVL